MSLQLRRRVSDGRTRWIALTANYVVFIDGGRSTWYVTIRFRDDDELAQYIDRSAAGTPLASRDHAAQVAETWIRANNKVYA